MAMVTFFHSLSFLLLLLLWLMEWLTKTINQLDLRLEFLDNFFFLKKKEIGGKKKKKMLKFISQISLTYLDKNKFNLSCL